MKYLTKTCLTCQEDFEVREAEVLRGYGKYCSKTCSSSRPRDSIIPQHNTKCAYCHKPIYKRPSHLRKSKSGVFYCNKEHQTLGVTSGIHRTGPKSKNSKGVECRGLLRYGCLKFTKRGEGVCKTCEKREKITKWVEDGNIEVTWVGPNKDPNPFVKEYLIETRGTSCEECGFDDNHPIDGHPIITMDHIDGDYTNNREDNLKLLCPNCHAMTPTYGSRNSGNGRGYRRKLATVLSEEGDQS